MRFAMTLGGIRGLVVCYKSSATHTKDFGEKKCTKVTRFQIFSVFFFWNQHIQTIGSSRSPKHSKILKTLYFPLWPIAKFGYYLLWMIANMASSQNWEKKSPQLQLVDTEDLINIMLKFMEKYEASLDTVINIKCWQTRTIYLS